MGDLLKADEKRLLAEKRLGLTPEGGVYPTIDVPREELEHATAYAVAPILADLTLCISMLPTIGFLSENARRGPDRSGFLKSSGFQAPRHSLNVV